MTLSDEYGLGTCCHVRFALRDLQNFAAQLSTSHVEEEEEEEEEEEAVFVMQMQRKSRQI